MNTIMNRITQISLLLVCMFVALPLRAQRHYAERMDVLIDQFLRDKQVTITDGPNAITKDASNPEERSVSVEFTCKSEKPLKRLLAAFEDEHFKHFADIYHSYVGSGEELTQALLAVVGPKGNEKRRFIGFTLRQNARVIVFGLDEEEFQIGYVLQWDDLPKGEKKGFVSAIVGHDMEIVKVEKGDDQITMDSVRTAIKIGEVVRENKNNAQIEIDTTYIDGKWAVSTKFHRGVLRAMDHVSDYQDGFPAIMNKVNELVERSKGANEAQLASIGFALKREASRYELLLTPEQFAMLWKGLYNLESKAKNGDPQIQDYFKAAESILRGKVNESVRLEYHDAKRHQFLRDIGFTVTKNVGGRWYYAVSGKHYTGNPDLEYLDACADEDGVLKYHAQHVERNLIPGIYRLTAAGRTSYSGYTGAFIFAQTEGKPLLKEIPACDDHEGDIWKDAAIRVKEADEKGQQISPQDVRIALANGGMGYGWSKIVIDNIEVRNGTLTYGVSCDSGFTGKQFTGRWLSAVDFVLERVGDLSSK